MADSEATPITQLLRRWREGDPAAERELFDVLHAELRRLAGHFMRGERRDHTLQPTELVHEVYLRLRPAEVEWRDRVHFFAMAGRVMRRVLTDHARARKRAKRAGVGRQVTLDDEVMPGGAGAVDFGVLDQALDRLEAQDERKARFVEMRYLAGLSNHEIAEAAGTSERTVKRELQFARAWLRRVIAELVV